MSLDILNQIRVTRNAMTAAQRAEAEGLAYGSVVVTPGAAGTATIAHLLGAAPAYVSVHLVGNSANEAAVQAVNATNITVRIRNSTTNANVTTGTHTVMWLARL